MPSLPFRLEAHPASPESLLRMAESAGRAATRRNRFDAFHPASLALAQLERARSLPFETLRLTMAHPDERVPVRAVELLADPDNRVLTAQWRAYIRSAALVRGLADAKQEGRVWGPLLDTLAGIGQWPTETAHAAQVRASGAFPLPAPVQTYRSAAAQVDDLRPWLREADETALLTLLQARSLEVRLSVARHAGRPTQAFVDACLAHPVLVDALAGNPNLAMRDVRRIADWILPRLTTAQSTTAPVAGAALRTLEAAGHRVPSDLVDALVAYAASPARLRDERDARVRSLRAVLALPRSLAQGMLDQLVSAAAQDEEAGARIVRHSEAGQVVWQTVARETPHMAVQAQLLLVPAAAADPVVRHALSSARESGILIGVLRHAEPDEGARIYARLVQRDIEAALAVIEADPVAAARIPPTSVLPLLENEDRTVRERAMGALTSIGTRSRQRA